MAHENMQILLAKFHTLKVIDSQDTNKLLSDVTRQWCEPNRKSLGGISNYRFTKEPPVFCESFFLLSDEITQIFALNSLEIGDVYLT